MSYAVLMAYVDADGMPEKRVHLAASLADKFNATLIGLSALGPPLLGKGVVFQEVTESDIKEMRALLAAKGNWFRSIAGDDHRRLEWRPILDFPTDALARAARSADLIVIGHTIGAGDAYRSLDPGGSLLTIGRPTGSGAAQLIKLAQDDGADLLVTGAYGRSRLGEWIFGGMTRDLLATNSICCLMSH